MVKYLFFKKERFSIRKFSVGAASVLIGTSLFAGAGSAHAEETTVATSAKTVDLHYLNEKELTADEQKLLENFQKSHTVEADDVAYYYVYRPSQKSLPNTGSTEIAGLAVAGATLLVAALVLSRKNKRLAVTLFALGSGGLLTTTVLADSQLAQFFENAQVAVNGDIPQPKAIEGYEFTGYFYRRKESKSTTTPVVPQVDKDKPVPTPVTPLEPVKPVQPDEKKDENADKPNPKPEPNPQPEQVKTAKGDQTDGGSANVEPALPEFPVEKVPVETSKGTSVVQEALPSYTAPVPTYAEKGEPSVQEELPAYTSSVPTYAEKGTPVVQEALPSYTDPVPTYAEKGTPAVQEDLPSYTAPVPTYSEKGTPSVQEELPSYTDPVPTYSEKGTPSVQEELSAYTAPVPTYSEKGTPSVQEELPSYTDPVPTYAEKGNSTTQESLPELKIEEQDYQTRYEADPTLPFGQRTETGGSKGQVVTEIRKIPGEGSSEIAQETIISSTPAVEKVIKIGNIEKATEIIARQEVISEAEDLAKGKFIVTDEGRDGSKTTLTIHEVDEKTGLLKNEKKTEETVAMSPKRITWGTLYEYSDIGEMGVTYKPDPSLPLGDEVEEDSGYAGLLAKHRDYYHMVNGGYEATPYKTETEQVNEASRNRVVRIGTMPSVKEVEVPFTTSYVADPTAAYGTRTPDGIGQNGKNRLTTTYQLDSDGHPYANEPMPEVVTAPRNVVVKVGTMPQTTTMSEESPRKFVADNTKEYGSPNEEIAGSPRIVSVTTTYTVNPETGDITPHVGQPVETQALKETIIKVGTKPSETSTAVPFETEYQADPALKYNERKEKVAGADGIDTTRTTYTLVGERAEIERTTTERTQAVRNKIIAIGNVEVVTQTIPIETEEREDPTKDKGVVETTEGSEGRITTTKTYVVDPKTGNLITPSETVDTVPMKKKIIVKGIKETVEKQVDFNDVTKREVFRVTDTGVLEPITGFESKPTNISDYVVKLTRQNHKDVLLPVTAINEAGEQFKVVVEGAEFAGDEGVTLDKIKAIPGAFTKFSELVKAIQENPAGNYKLASDMVADDVIAADTGFYIDNFTGTLESVEGDKLFSIKGLTRPLFNTLTNATVKNIKLNDLKVVTAKAAALALTTTGATIENVHTRGDVTGTETASGLVQEATNTKISKVSVSGMITLNRPNIHVENIFVGGVAGRVSGGSLTKALVDASINTNIPTIVTNKYVGGVVGQGDSTATVSELVAKGTLYGAINNKYGNALVGGVVGQLLSLPSSIKLLGMNKVQDGDSISGGAGRFWLTYANANTVSEVSSGTSNKLRATSITKDQAEKRILDWDILPVSSSTTNTNSIPTNTSTDAPINYTSVTDAQAERATAYDNVSKLLPFYDAKTIVKYGNDVKQSDKLFTTKVIAVVPLEGDTPIGITGANADKIKQILIHYEDGKVEKRSVTPIGNYKTSKVYEYQLENGLIFTPEQLMTDRRALISELSTEFKKVAFDSEEMKKAVKLAEAHTDKVTYTMDDLFWKSTFKDVQGNMDSILEQLLANDTVLGDSSQLTQATKKKLLDKKAEVLVGLSYLARLYNIHFDGMSIKNILTYRPDFYGHKQDVIDWLASFANLSFKELMVMNNETTYNKQMAPLTNNKTVKEFLEKHKEKFISGKTMNDWYKSASKASVVEVASQKRPEADVQLYTWLTSYQDFRAYLLPLLNLRDDSIYITTNMSFITFGLKDRHISDQTLRVNNPSKYKEEVAKVEALVARNAERWAKFVDTWYGIVDDKVKEKMVRPHLSVWGGFQMSHDPENKNPSATWLSHYDTEYKAMEDFMAATGDYFSWARKPASARSAVRKQDDIPTEYSKIEYVQTDLLTDEGASTLSHEFVHALDEIALLDGYKLRPGQDPESYAYGMLESAITKDGFYYALNLMQDFKGALATSNQSNDRFKSAEDIGQYVKGLYDVTYTLDAIEAEKLVALPKERQKLFFDKIVQVNKPTRNGLTNNDDEIKEITDSEWKNINLSSLNDLIDNDLVAYDQSVHIRKKYVQTDEYNYYIISLTSPIYSGFQSKTGTSSGLLFRKMAWDVIAEKGWKDGFIPFATDKLASDAKAENKSFTDEYAFKKVMGTNQSYAEFKKEKYAKHLADADKLKSVTIEWNGKSHTINSKVDIENLMNEAIQMDIKRYDQMNNRLYVQQQSRKQLKEAIIKAYLNKTNDFRESVYK